MLTRVPTVSVVIPTYLRPGDVADLVMALAHQTMPPTEVVVVDGAPKDDIATEVAIGKVAAGIALPVRYVRSSGGAAYQRNEGIEVATGDFIAFIDDDVRPYRDFLEVVARTFAADEDRQLGCVSGRFDGVGRGRLRLARFRLYRRLGLITTLKPGAFDFESGIAISRHLEDDIPGLRNLQVVGTTCAVWRKAVFEEGHRFAPFFRTYFGNEDYHFALTAGQTWRIVDHADARFAHGYSPLGRHPARLAARHQVINNRFVFVDFVPQRTRAQEFRFWSVELLELAGYSAAAIGSLSRAKAQWAVGHVAGAIAAWRKWPGRFATTDPGDRSDEV